MNKKISLVIVANTSNFFNVFMLNHIYHLSKNYDLTICCDDSSKLKKITPKNVSFTDINFKRGISFYHDIIAFFFTLFFFFKKKPDLSISFTPKIGFIVSICAFLTRTPTRIHWYTGQIWVNKTGIKKFFFRYIDKFIFLLSNEVLVDGISQRKFLIKENIISRKKSYVLHKGSVGGVNIKKFKFSRKKNIQIRKKFKISKNTFVFLYLGRINEDKGVIDLIKAFKKIEIIYDSILIFVGSVEDVKFNDHIKKEENILYFKYTKNPENWFSAANVICLPSYREGFGNVIIEAASCGIPALCSNIYGLKDAVIDNKTGFFHRAGDINDIKKKMTYIVKNKNLLKKKYGFHAKKRVIKDFQQNLITAKLLEFLSLKIKNNVN